MMECMKSMARKPQDEPVEMVNERIKVSHLDIIVTMIDKKPYYEIKYKEIGANHYSVGYSSYKLENVLAWRDECFEVAEKPQTNADRIRSMTDEELAELLYSLQTEDLDGMFCKTEDKCEEMMDSGDEIPKSMCKQCLVKWLKEESEE